MSEEEIRSSNGSVVSETVFPIDEKVEQFDLNIYEDQHGSVIGEQQEQLDQGVNQLEIVQQPENQSSEQENPEPNNHNENDTKIEVEEDDDDDFGAFSDASFDEFEAPIAAPTKTDEEELIEVESSTTYTKFPTSIFQDESQLRTKLDELINQVFPEQLQPFTIPDNTNILNERSEHLLERLTALPYLKPYNWHRSSIRRQLLSTLGLPDDTLAKPSRINTFDATDYRVTPFGELNISPEEKKTLLEESEHLLKELIDQLSREDVETLSQYDSKRIDEVIIKYYGNIQKIDKLLSVWEDEEKKLTEDHTTFEGVVENLVGHTQRLRREETLKSLKKKKENSKRISTIFKKITK